MAQAMQGGGSDDFPSAPPTPTPTPRRSNLGVMEMGRDEGRLSGVPAQIHGQEEGDPRRWWRELALPRMQAAFFLLAPPSPYWLQPVSLGCMPFSSPWRAVSHLESRTLRWSWHPAAVLELLPGGLVEMQVAGPPAFSGA